MDQPGRATVYLPEVSLYEHGVLAQMGLTTDDIRTDNNGALWHVKRNGQPKEQFTARTRTHMGLAIVITFSCKAGDESDLTCAIETFLFALALADIRFHRSAMGLALSQLTICCSRRVQGLIAREVCHAAEFGSLAAFAPIAFRYKRMSKSSKLGNFDSAFDAAAAAAIASKEHIHDHAIHMETHTDPTRGDRMSKRSCLAPRIREVLRDAHKASSEQYYSFWSLLSVE